MLNSSFGIPCVACLVLVCAVVSTNGLPAEETAGSADDPGFLASHCEGPYGQGGFYAAGPFFERQEMPDGRSFVALRPFYSRLSDPSRDRTLREYLWPVGMHRYMRGETYWRFLNVFGIDFEGNGSPRYRFVVFPVVFAGRNEQGERHFAVFPLGGRVNDFIGRDRINFFLFPLYMSTTVKDMRATDVLWPFFSWSSGGNNSSFRIFPFYGRSVNGDGITKQFVLWPVWTQSSYDTDKIKGSGYVLFPFIGHAKLRGQESWWLVPPLFKSAEGRDYRAVNCPWPFFQYESGTCEKLYFWPVWGTRSSHGARNTFFIWPLIWKSRKSRDDMILSRFDIVPFLTHESVSRPAGDDGRDAGAEAEVTGRYFKLWPLLSYRREDDTRMFRTLALWPLKHTAPIERNYTPFWTLYSSVSGKKGSEDILLWGLYRNRKTADGASRLSLFPVLSLEKSDARNFIEFRLFYGLTGYRREGLRRQWRLLYFINFSSGKVLDNDNP